MTGTERSLVTAGLPAAGPAAGASPPEAPLALVTGGGRGIGAAISRRLAADGYRVLLTYATDSESAEATVEAIRLAGGDAFAAKLDAGEAGEVHVLANHPWVRAGLDVLVLNHGRYERVAADALDAAQLARTMDTNFRGAVAVWEDVRSALRADARTIVIGSQLAIRGSPHGADYAASKAALHAWARSLAQAVGPSGQRVNVVAPGFVDTAILAGDSPEKRRSRVAEVPLRRIGSPEDVAGVVAFLAGPDSAYVTGAVVHVNGGLYLP